MPNAGCVSTQLHHMQQHWSEPCLSLQLCGLAHGLEGALAAHALAPHGALLHLLPMLRPVAGVAYSAISSYISLPLPLGVSNPKAPHCGGACCAQGISLAGDRDTVAMKMHPLQCRLMWLQVDRLVTCRLRTEGTVREHACQYPGRRP